MDTMARAYPWGKLALLTLLLFLTPLGTAWLLGLQVSVPGASTVELFTSLAAAALLQAALVLELVRRSAWWGFKLALAVFLVYFGVVSFLTWIEALLFLNVLVHKMPAREVHLGLVQGFVTAVAVGALSARLAGPSAAGAENPASAGLPGSRPLSWAWRMTFVALVYVVIFFLFGLFVAIPLAGPAFDEFYKDLQPSAWLPLLELGRGFVWALLAVLIIRMLNLDRNRTALLTGLTFAVLMGSLLISPNPVITDDRLRWSHFVEVTTENFLFGWLSVWILTHRKQPRPAGDRLGRAG